MVTHGNHFKTSFFSKGGSQHRNLLSHLGVIELEGDMREREEREREEYVHVATMEIELETHS